MDNIIRVRVNAAKDGVGAEETPCGGWSVMRLRTAAHGTLAAPRLGSMLGPKGGLGEHGDAVSRQLILTKVSLVERRLDNYEVSWYHTLLYFPSKSVDLHFRHELVNHL